MINLSTTSPVARPVPMSAAMAPVSATPAIKPVQPTERDPATDMDTRRDTQRQRARADEKNAAPAVQPGLLGASQQASTQVRPEASVQRAEQARQKAEADKATHHQAMDRLQEVLTSMWAASAAVVDQALGFEPNGERLPGNQSDTAPDLSAVAASTMSRRLLPGTKAAQLPDSDPANPLPWPVMQQAAEEAAAAAGFDVPGGEVVAYDERGNSSLAPLETGTLLSEKA